MQRTEVRNSERVTLRLLSSANSRNTVAAKFKEDDLHQANSKKMLRKSTEYSTAKNRHIHHVNQTTFPPGGWRFYKGFTAAQGSNIASVTISTET